VIPIYVINLGRAHDRRAWMESELARVGLAATFIPAIDGLKLGPKCREWLANCRGPYRLSPGEASLIFSHRKVWRAFLAGGARHALVLEDDVHLGRDFAPLLAVDWSQWTFDVVKLETITNRQIWLSRRSWPLPGRRLHRLGSAHWGTAAYIVSVAGARKLLQRTRIEFEPVDHTIFGAKTLASGAVDALQVEPAAAIQDFFRAATAQAVKLPSSLSPMRGAPAAPLRRGATPLSQRLAREARRIVNQPYATWRRLSWRQVVIPFE
jgi:glycosyl transferase family 25